MLISSGWQGGVCLYIGYASVVVPLEEITRYSKTTLPQITGIPRVAWVITFFVNASLTLGSHEFQKILTFWNKFKSDLLVKKR